MTQLTFEVLMNAVDNKVLDFGPPLPAPAVCTAWTVERLSLWEHTTTDKFEMVAVRAAYLDKARVRGTLYNMSDEQVYALDRERGEGVYCDRKLLPIMVSVTEPNPINAMLPCVQKFNRTLAYVYVGRKEHWVFAIENAPLRKEPELFRLAQRHPDNNPLLNNNFCFLPPPVDYGRVYTGNARVLRKAGNANKVLSRKMFWLNVPKRVKNFLRDDE